MLTNFKSVNKLTDSWTGRLGMIAVLAAMSAAWLQRGQLHSATFELPAEATIALMGGFPNNYCCDTPYWCLSYYPSCNAITEELDCSESLMRIASSEGNNKECYLDSQGNNCIDGGTQNCAESIQCVWLSVGACMYGSNWYELTAASCSDDCPGD